MTQDQAHELLEPHYERLCIAVVNAWRRYRKYPSRTIHRRSTRATIVNDEIIAAIIAEFHEVGDTKPVEIRKKNLRFLMVGERILLWFKKTDRMRRLRIYPTLHAQHMEKGGQLSFFPNQEILVVGYLLNRDETKVIRVSICKPSGIGMRPEWFIDLEPGDEQSIAVIDPKTKPGAPGRPRVSVKPGALQGTLIQA